VILGDANIDDADGIWNINGVGVSVKDRIYVYKEISSGQFNKIELKSIIQ